MSGANIQLQLQRRRLSSLRLETLMRRQLSQLLQSTLDRVNVLGDEGSYGHSGCVNALSWARGGELLLSGGDDTTVRIWGIDPADTSQEYPFVCRSVIHTGHTDNIFSAQMLPYSSKIATVAGDHQIRVFDIGEAALNASNGKETSYNTRQSLVHKIRCHDDRVKRIVTEFSPDLFLTVGEDGTVRQHDLRAPHDCHREPCPTPLLTVSHELSTISLSPLTPHLFVVAGESPYGYLFDRRHIGRNLRSEWGLPSSMDDDGLTTCVRRFCKPKLASTGSPRRRMRSEHITGARMSSYNGHEVSSFQIHCLEVKAAHDVQFVIEYVITAYSGDGVYLFSTYDNPGDEEPKSQSESLLLPSNSKSTQKLLARSGKTDAEPSSSKAKSKTNPDIADPRYCLSPSEQGSQMTEDDDDDNDDTDDDDDDDDDNDDIFGFDDPYHNEDDYLPRVPVVLPRQRYTGASNVRTIKDGPNDELVASGSDDGNFFVWHKMTGALQGIYEGDGSVVNMIEGHPHLPLVAVSGIDYTVKASSCIIISFIGQL
ncbi:hypothetical protein H0H93_009539 [Arthromyces matolae]|nr:hypothetical protein H0H93_009539 [Arthromyces matolae]